MPADRPAIPVDTKREVLFEARHHCAVCCEALPLEYAHIIPWRATQDHSAANLIALCANCHERADKESWGVDYLQRYKKAPCILARGVPPAFTPEQKAVVDLIVARNPEEMTDRERQRLVSMVAAYAGIAIREIEVISVLPANSARIRLVLPPHAARRIIEGFKEADPLLYAFLSEADLLRVEPYTLNRDQSFYAKIKLIMAFLRSWTETTRGYIHFVNKFAIVFGVIVFTLEFAAKVHTATMDRGGIGSLENWFMYVFNNPLVIVLILVIDWIYVSQRNAVRLEEAIAQQLFDASKLPRISHSRLFATLFVVGHLAIFAMLVWFSDEIKIVSSLFTLVSLIDLQGRMLINKELRRYLSDGAFPPSGPNSEGVFIHRRRAVVAAFVRDRLNIQIELWRAICCLAATFVSIGGYVFDRSDLNGLAYVILISTLVIHQVITVRWRIKYYLDLAIAGETLPIRPGAKPTHG